MPANPIRPLLHSVMERSADFLIPFQVSIELTHRCNLSCRQCYIDVPDVDELSFAEIKDVLDQLAESGTMYLLFTGGEPLLRRDFFDIAFYAKDKGFLVMLLTNGTLITQSVARDIEKLDPVSVGISLHGASSRTHDNITGKQGSFVSMINAVKLLKNLAVQVSLQTLLMNSNFHEAEAIKELAQTLGVFHRFTYEIVPARSGSFSPFQFEADIAKICTNFSSERSEECDIKTTAKKVCKAGHGICSISPSGDVFPCLLMPMKVGNLRTKKFDEIWRTGPCPELTYLRSLTWQDLSACKECKLAGLCRTCMGVAFTETGGLTKPAPSACRYAAAKAESLTNGVIA